MGVHQVHIRDAMAPAKFVQCENWVVLHYWNAEKSRYEFYVVDLFEPKADEGAWKLLTSGDAAESRSAFQLDTPVPLQQTFIFPTSIHSMGVTNTEKGISPKAILIALKNQ